MKPKRRRLWFLTLITLFISGATLIILTTLNDHLLFFMMPTDVLREKPTTPIRLGGLVEEGSFKRQDNLWITFRITDGAHSIPAKYQGIVPDLFCEGQGVVAEGALSNEGVFEATHLLAKHDENYMPAEVAETLKKNGLWKPENKLRKGS